MGVMGIQVSIVCACSRRGQGDMLVMTVKCLSADNQTAAGLREAAVNFNFIFSLLFSVGIIM